MIFHQFSYAGDSAKSVMSIASIRRLFPNDPIYLWSDSAAPISPDLDYGDGVIVRQTSFSRMGNLNGFACVAGMQECYRIGFRENPGEEFHVKIDPDVLLLNRNAVGKLGYFSCPIRAGRAYGWIQIHSRQFHEDYLRSDIRKLCTVPSFGEDVTFHQAATKLCAGRAVTDAEGC